MHSLLKLSLLMFAPALFKKPTHLDKLLLSCPLFNKITTYNFNGNHQLILVR